MRSPAFVFPPPPRIPSRNRPCSARSRSAIVTGRPRSTRLVTPCSETPQGTMPAKCESSGSTLMAMPLKLTQRRNRMPIAAILSSAGWPSGSGGRVRPRHPDADAILAALAFNVELGQRADDPVFQRRDEGAHILAPPLEVEHDIGHALAGPVIGVFAAAAGLVDRQPVGLDQVGKFRAGACRIERRMLDQPDQLLLPCPSRIVGGALLHEGDGKSIVDKSRLDPPFDGRRPGAGMERRGELAAVEHRFSGLNAIIWMGRAPPSSATVIRRRDGLLAAPNYGRHGPCFAGSDLLHAASRFRPVSFVTCGRGGIGRRAALRSLWGNPWKFESSRPHQSEFPGN